MGNFQRVEALVPKTAGAAALDREIAFMVSRIQQIDRSLLQVRTQEGRKGLVVEREALQIRLEAKGEALSKIQGNGSPR
jgi:hypothetical protein